MGDLAGKTVVLTRAAGESAELCEQLTARGAQVVEVPAIAIRGAGSEEEQAAALAALPETAWVSFSSRNGVRHFRRILDANGHTLPDDIRLAAVGVGTAEEVAALLRPADLVADVSTAEGLSEALLRAARPEEGRVLLPSASRGRRVLEDTLRAAGFDVRRLIVYETHVATEADGPVTLPDQVDFVVFTSPSTVRGFLALGAMPSTAVAVSIGPSTSAALREAGVAPVREAARHDLVGVEEAIS